VGCPVCGGSEREQLAPGLWRCTSQRTVITEHGGPGLTNPAAGPGVIRREHVVPCGTEYQEGGGPGIVGVECRCGTFAIGRCSECREPVCGIHSTLIEDRRVCSEHAEQKRRIAAEATAAAERTRAEAEAREQRERMAALEAVQDPAEAATLIEDFGSRVGLSAYRALWVRLAATGVVQPTHDIVILDGHVTSLQKVATMLSNRNYEIGTWLEVARAPAWAAGSVKLYVSSLVDNEVWLDRAGDVLHAAGGGALTSDNELTIASAGRKGVEAVVPVGRPFRTVRPSRGHRFVDGGLLLWRGGGSLLQEDYRAMVAHALRGGHRRHNLSRTRRGAQ
jgi:hypothetical protein